MSWPPVNTRHSKCSSTDSGLGEIIIADLRLNPRYYMFKILDDSSGPSFVWTSRAEGSCNAADVSEIAKYFCSGEALVRGGSYMSSHWQGVTAV
jgi:hypothetical protein